MLIQALLYLKPPSQGNLTYAGNILYDSSIEVSDITNQIDSNYRQIGDILQNFGIAKDNLSLANTLDTPNLSEGAYMITRWPITKGSYEIKLNDSHHSVFATKSDNLDDNLELEAPYIVGESDLAGNFAISTSTGSVYVTSIPEVSEATPGLTHSINYANITTGAHGHTVKPGDRIRVTLTATNNSIDPVQHSFRLHTGDASEYLSLSTTPEDSGFKFNTTDHQASWGEVEISPNSSQSREIILKAKSTPVNLPQNPTHTYSQDCLATLTYGPDQTDIPVECGARKELELFTSTIPKINQLQLLVATAIVFAVSTLLLIRALQEEEEIRIIRHKFNSGS